MFYGACRGVQVEHVDGAPERAVCVIGADAQATSTAMSPMTHACEPLLPVRCVRARRDAGQARPRRGPPPACRPCPRSAASGGSRGRSASPGQERHLVPPVLLQHAVGDIAAEARPAVGVHGLVPRHLIQPLPQLGVRQQHRREDVPGAVLGRCACRGSSPGRRSRGSPRGTTGRCRRAAGTSWPDGHDGPYCGGRRYGHGRVRQRVAAFSAEGCRAAAGGGPATGDGRPGGGPGSGPAPGAATSCTTGSSARGGAG